MKMSLILHVNLVKLRNVEWMVVFWEERECCVVGLSNVGVLCICVRV